MKNKNKITIAIPSFNNEKHIGEAIDSALMQEYPLKEIIVCDDASKDNTALLAHEKLNNSYVKWRIIVNEFNLGIGKNLEKLMTECNTRYIIYLCADDIFTHPKVLNDIVHIFDSSPDIGVVGRYYYYFMNGHKGAIGTCRDENILTSSCCPSGMAFRRQDNITCENKAFIEMPSIVSQYLKKYRWTFIPYDTVAARFCPGVNTGTKKSYYTESPTQNWINLLNCNYQDFPVFVTLKNRAPKLLWKEIMLHINNDQGVLMQGNFWKYALVALLVPSVLLKHLTLFYRHRIARNTAFIIERKKDV